MAEKEISQYTDKLKNHPIFKNKKIRTDNNIKKMFESTFLIYKSIIEEELSDELEVYTEGDICDDRRRNHNGDEEDCCGKACEEKDEDNYEEKSEEEEYCSKKIDETEEEVEFDIATEYAVLFVVVRLYKIFEHILLRKYIIEKKLFNIASIDEVNFEDVLLFLKKNKVIKTEEEENSIYLMQLLVNSVEENFLFQYSEKFEDSLLTDDKYMFCDVDHGTIYQTIANLSYIVERL